MTTGSVKLDEPLKRCTKCKEPKPRSAFWKQSNTSDRLRTHCKDCFKLYFREHRYPKLKNSATYKSQHADCQRRYAKRHPDVIAAHIKANTHKAKLKSNKCQQCRSAKHLHMHHPDYSHSLNVITLCGPCHEAVHHRGLTV